jgi:hypothetical protein
MAIATPVTRKPARGLWIILGTGREGAGAGFSVREGAGAGFSVGEEAGAGCIKGSSTASEPRTEGGGASDADGIGWTAGAGAGWSPTECGGSRILSPPRAPDA